MKSGLALSGLTKPGSLVERERALGYMTSLSPFTCLALRDKWGNYSLTASFLLPESEDSGKQRALSRG